MKTLTSILVLLFGLQAATAQPLQRVAPEQAGLDSRKLMYADKAIETAIAGKEIPGAVLAVVRNGKMAYLKAYGQQTDLSGHGTYDRKYRFRYGILQQVHIHSRMHHDSGRTRKDTPATL